MKQTIVLSGQFMDFSGYGWAVRSYARMFKQKFSNVLFCDISQEKRTKDMEPSEIDEYKRSLRIEDIEFTDIDKLDDLVGDVFYFECFIPSINIAQFVRNIPHPSHVLNDNPDINLKKISMVAWETNLFSNMFVKGLHDFGFDALILHTSEHFSSIEKQVKIPTYVNHYPIFELFDPDTKIKKRNTDFNIVSINAFQPRKGWDELISAYYSAFYEYEDVCLRIKTHGDNEKIADAIRKLKKYHGAVEFLGDSQKGYTTSVSEPKCRIEIDNRFLSESEIEEYYKDFDLFTCATKGEGFGLTIAQAGASGIPIMCPDKGGHNDFCPDFSYKVETYTAACLGLGAPFYTGKNMYIFQSDHLSLKSKFIEAYDDWKSGIIEDKGEKTKAYIRERLSTDKSYKNILKIMEELR